MQLTPISDSSHVAAIGYEDGHIVVQFKDRRLYRWERPREIFAALERAASKGRFLKLLGKGARIGVADPPADGAPTPTKSLDVQTPTSPGVLNSLSNEASACCWRAFGKLGLAEKLDRAETFECPVCGQEYRPRLDGAIRHWEPHCWMVNL